MKYTRNICFITHGADQWGATKALMKPEEHKFSIIEDADVVVSVDIWPMWRRHDFDTFWQDSYNSLPDSRGIEK